MRHVLLLLPLLLLAFAHPIGLESPGEEEFPKLVVGPLLTPPDPSVYSTLPFILQPTGQRVSVEPARPQEDLAVLLIEFPDEAASRDRSEMNALVFDTSPGAASVYNYYLENSYGKTTIGGLVTDRWYLSDRTMDYYGEDGEGFDDRNGPIYCLTVEAVLKADADVDFSRFDTDGDGVVDHLVVIHAGRGQENTQISDLIWSHRWAVIDATDCGLSDRRLTVDGVQIYGYFMASEESPMGVFAHELGHDFGLPDLYDTTGNTLGIGVWGVMGTGSWNGGGNQPAHFTAWSKAKLGWLELTEVTEPLLPASIPQVETSAVAYRLSIRSSPLGDEYFILENRQRVGFDAGLPGSGLLIWHVDETRRNNDDPTHRLVDLEEADEGRGLLYADRPDQPSDPWQNSLDGFTPTSVPNSNDYGGARTGWKVTSIGPSASTMTANITKGVAVDISILDILKRDFVSVNTSVPVDVRLVNKGLADVTNATLALDVYYEAYDSNSRVFSQVEAVPAMQEEEVVTLSFTFGVTRPGRYIIEALATVVGDEVPEDNDRIVHLIAGEYLLAEDVEGLLQGWQSPNTDSAYRWEVVDVGDSYGEAHSPVRSWRFGYFGITDPVNYTYYHLESPDVALQGFTPYLVYYQIYRLSTRTVDNATEPLESDVATVEVSFDGGPWIPVASFTGTQTAWERVYVDLSGYAQGASSLKLRFNATAGVMPDDGGWWIDDIIILTQPLERAALVKALDGQKEIVPGGSVSFLFMLVNIGDLEEEYHFQVEGLPVDWEALIGVNETTAAPVEDYSVRLVVDEQLFLRLIVRAPLLAERGVLVQGMLIALTPEEEVGASFIFAVQVPLGFALSLTGRTLVVAVIIGGVMLAIAVVLTALKKREGY